MHSHVKVGLDHNTVNTAFVLDGITSLGYRVDGRAFGQRRPLSFEFGTKDSSVVVRLGKTVVTACVAARIEAPMHSRMSEGSLRCIVRDATFLSGKKVSGSQRELLQLYERFLDRAYKESKAVDMESLCIQSGKYVWYVEVQLTVMNDDGGVLDALGWAGLAAMRVFLREEVEVRGKGRRQGVYGGGGGSDGNEDGPLKIYGLDAREGVGMTLHHFPVAVTFAMFEKGGEQAADGTGDGEDRDQDRNALCVLVDPTAVEEASASGHMTISITPQGELCAVQKADGCGVAMSEVFGCMRRGMELAKEGCDVLDAALGKHAVDRVAARVKKHDRSRAAPRVVTEHPSGNDIGETDRGTPEDVRRAILASQKPDEDDDDDPDVRAAGAMATEGADVSCLHPAVNEAGTNAQEKKRGRRYREENRGAGKAVYKQASNAVVERTQGGNVESLGDALR
jgi:exosome complex component RRP45